jgi:hypothetical protein
MVLLSYQQTKMKAYKNFFQSIFILPKFKDSWEFHG